MTLAAATTTTTTTTTTAANARQARQARQAAAQADWKAKALAIAEAKHTIGTARHIGENEYHAQLYRVPSWSHDGAVYLVTLWPTAGVTCCCTAGTYGRPCKHAGAALHAERQRTAVETGPDMNTWAWMNTECY